MPTAIQSEELVVWAPPVALEEAKTKFAGYSPKFHTLPCKLKAERGKTWVSVLYLPSPEKDASIEKTFATLRNCKISTLFVYTPDHSMEAGYCIGTMIGRHQFNATLASSWPHLKQLLKARNICAHAQPNVDQASSSALLDDRKRLGLSQTQMATALNVNLRTLQNWEAGKGTSQVAKKTRNLRDLLSRMDDYVVATKEKEWLTTPLEAFEKLNPKELIIEGRMRDLVIEFDRLREGQPV